ncbi:MAG: 3-methyl-2-oxobutanoate hydroxymethyltransferase [Phycisphaerae bacterium]|jgi:3-methyl-2-oxobutanoate hydroxymethyltransferase|nr:3-methyl-2-oxobutanoate hydroxymethyltransferase [Phycisphaerae bacterium]
MDKNEKITLEVIQNKIHAGQRISMLALYDYPFAALAQQAGIDSIIVGDSAAMVNYGYDSTLQADMDMMIRHTQAVKRGAPNVFLIGDMPFMSYQPTIETAIRNAGRFIAEGHADAVKLEGGTTVLDTVHALVKATIPVVGHLGLTPQSAAITGKFKAQGRQAQSAVDLVNQARQLEQAGICMLILECVPNTVSEAIVQKLSIPVISIGSGPACHGQVLVLFDILGIYPRFTPKFVRKYAQLAPTITQAIQAYIRDIAQGTYPAQEHTYAMKPGEEEEFRKMIE